MKQNAFNLFLHQKRFDLIFKYLYLKYPDNNFIKKAYLENIRAFNGFYEIEPSDGIPKTSPENFVSSFNRLYCSIKEHGFDKNLGTIPIGDNGEITDGAHRLAACAFLNLEVETKNDGRNDLYNYLFFKKQGMNPDIMDYGALEYVKLNPYAYIVNLHSISPQSEDEKVISLLEKFGFVYYKKEINPSFNAYVNLKKISYGSFWEKEKWIGCVENKFKGAQAHARRSIGKNPLRVFVFVCDDLKKVVQVKAEIRAMFNIGNYSVHINDTRDEAIWLAETYFNKNSLNMINNRPFYFEDEDFEKKMDELKQLSKQSHINLEYICCSGSTPLNIYGLRKSSDLDFLYFGDKQFNIQNEILSNHDSELQYYPFPKKEIIENPKYHFYFHGMKFISLDVLYLMKKKRNEIPKDRRDCKLIKSISDNKMNYLKRIKSIFFHT